MNIALSQDELPSPLYTLLRDEITLVTAFEPPGDEAEVSIAAIWARSFGLDKVGRNDDFFELGGDSYTATEIAFGIEGQFEMEFAPANIVDHATIAKQASFIADRLNRPQMPTCLVGCNVEGRQSPLFLIHGANGFTFFNNVFLDCLGKDQPIYLFHVPGLNGADPGYETLEQLAAIYTSAMQTIQPNGPYNIASICNGAFIGLEMCIRLQEKGERIKNLILIDPSQVPEKIAHHYPPTSQKNLQWLGLMKCRILRQVARLENYLSDLGLVVNYSEKRSASLMKKRRERIGSKINRLHSEGKFSEHELNCRIDDLVNAHFTLRMANANYVPDGAYRGHAHILVNNVYGLSTVRDDLFWKAHLGSLDYEVGPGTHRDFFGKNIRFVADFVKHYLTD
ncbi:MAG TPA: thioesterase domain-containing protein [Aestuariivirga sp.]|nr:thioesterase domain-containing protein [Aestuariivirga sp.]